MALHSTAQGLASLGRHGDSVLVHMQPEEVAGLQALARSRGTSLTINPATGMPEAFSLGGFFSSLLPMFAGAMFPGAGFAMAPLLAGAATGAGLAAIKGDNPLMGGLMGGLGGISGSNLGYGLMGPATTGGGFVPTQAAALTDAEVLKNAASAQSMMTNPTLMKTIDPNIVNATNTANQTGFFNSAIEKAGNIIEPKLNLVSQQASGAGNLLTGQPGAWDAFKGQFTSAEGVPISDFGAAMKIGMPVGGAVLGGLEPSDLGYGGPSIDEIKRQTKYRGPSGQLNLDYNYNQDTGEYESLPSLQLATGGSVNTNQSSVSSGGIQDLYGSNDNTVGNQQLSQDGYGIGRLDRLAQQGSLTKAGDMFYAAGGPVSFAYGGEARGGYLDGPGDGLSDSIPATIEGKQPARLADGEFVVSSDVVSALGNGSSKAGAKQLYAMMDRVRQKAHGTKKQINKVNTKQVMPA